MSAVFNFSHLPSVKTSYTTRRWRNNFKLPLSMCEVHFYYYQESLNRFPFFYFGYNLFSSADCWWEKKEGKILSDFFYYYLFSKWNSFMISYSQAFVFTRSMSALAISYYWFLNEIFFSILAQFLSEIFLLLWKVTTFFFFFENFSYFSLSFCRCW